MNRYQVVALMPPKSEETPREVFVLPTERTLPEEAVSLAHHLLPAEADLVADLYLKSIKRIKPRPGQSAYAFARLLGVAAHHAVMRWAVPERRADLRAQGFDPQGDEGAFYNDLFSEMRESFHG